ncbi:MAG: YfhO family protein, partial [Bacillota bacterium]
IIKYAAIAFSALFVLSLVLNGALRDWFTSRMLSSEKAKLQMNYFQAIADYTASMFTSDMIIAFLLSALSFGLAYASVKRKLSTDLFALSIILLAVFDLWRIDNRGAEYIQTQNMDEIFAEPDYVKAIKEQKDNSPFRIISLKENFYGTADNRNLDYHAYFLLQDIYGYSGIKPRAYQDYVDVLGNLANPTFWRMLNVKYVVLDKPVSFPGLAEIYKSPQSVLYRYEPALPRAYFVNSVQTKPALQILNLIKENAFDPKHTAFLEEGSLQVDMPDSLNSYVNIKSYKDEHITIDAKASGNNFLFLGDTYYPKGWKALVDGQETKIYRTNHNFRGIVVPKGTHKVEFIYAPASFYVSRIISLSLSSLVVLGIIAGLFFNLKKKNDQ